MFICEENIYEIIDFLFLLLLQVISKEFLSPKNCSCSSESNAENEGWNKTIKDGG